MAITKYKCGTCNRTIELANDNKGIGAFGRCIISNNCRGVLSAIEQRTGYIAGHARSSTDSYEDYQPRLLISRTPHEVLESIWYVQHNLYNVVEVEVFDNSGMRIIPLSIVQGVDLTYVVVELPTAATGVAVCRSQYAATPPIPNETLVREVVVSTDGFATIAIASRFGTSIGLNYTLYDKQHNTSTTSSVTLTAHTNSVWGDSANIYMFGRRFNVFNVPVESPTPVAFVINYLLISTTEIVPGENQVYLLCSGGDSPADKKPQIVVDTDALTRYNNTMQGRKCAVNDNIIIGIYPPITTA